MVDATTAPTALPADLDALVPRASRWRAIALIGLALAVLAGTWFSPALLRPSLDGAPDSSGSSGSSSLFPGQILTLSESSVRAWPSATLEGIDDVPGARVAAVWLLDTRPIDEAFETDANDALSMLRIVYSPAEVPEGGNLPAEFRTSDPVRLAILWDIDDCYALDENAEAFATLRTAIGTIARTPLPWAARPDRLLDAEFADDDEYSALACTPSTP